MGEVWLAERVSDVGASKLVALKMMTFGVASKESYARFLQEARVSMSMNHPNVVQVFDAGLHDGQAWLDLEYVEGVDLSRVAASLRANQQLPSEDAVVHLARSLLQALAHAHGLRSAPGGTGVVHRDVSPQNILVGVHGQLKLNDFGIARLVETIPSATSPVGKLRYMPPEQANGHVEPRSDLFGAGAVLHELLEGRKFRGHIPQAGMLSAAFTGAVAPIARPISPELHQLLTGLVSPDVGQRFQSAEAALYFMDQHGLRADASQEWAAASRLASASSAAQPAPLDTFGPSLSGDPTEHGTAETFLGAAHSLPTRTRARGKRPRWLIPTVILVSLAALAAPGFFAWRAIARSLMPTYEFNTGSAACDEYMWMMSRFERGPGEPYYSEAKLREIAETYATDEETCALVVEDSKKSGIYPTW